MRAIVLVGGFGTRLRPLTLTRPKQLLPIVGTTMIEVVVGSLAAQGVDDVVLSLGYRPDAFQERFPTGRCAGARLTYAREPEPMDTAGAVRFAATAVGIDERFLVLNGDVLTDLDLAALVGSHDASGAEGTLTLTSVDDPSRYGVVVTDDSGTVLAFIEKPPAADAPSTWINAGAYVLEPAVLDRIPAGRRVSIERETFPAMVADGALSAWRSAAYWIDAGTPAAYLQAQLDLLDGTRGVPLDGVDAAAVVDPAGSIRRSVVGRGVTVAPGAQVVDSVVMEGASVGAGAVVERSIVGSGATVGERAHLAGLTVVGDGADVEASRRCDGALIPPPEAWQ